MRERGSEREGESDTCINLLLLSSRLSLPLFLFCKEKINILVMNYAKYLFKRCIVRELRLLRTLYAKDKLQNTLTDFMDRKPTICICWHLVMIHSIPCIFLCQLNTRRLVPGNLASWLVMAVPFPMHACVMYALLFTVTHNYGLLLTSHSFLLSYKSKFSSYLRGH